jgi:hypothetical protein
MWASLNSALRIEAVLKIIVSGFILLPQKERNDERATKVTSASSRNRSSVVSPRGTLPYLRQSLNRLDAIAIVSFWISTIIREDNKRFRLFLALSTIRPFRLLTLTSGMAVISTSKLNPSIFMTFCFRRS